MNSIPHPVIVLATNNQGKVREFQEILSDININLVPQSDFGAPEVEETGLSFVENAILKARSAAAHTGLPALGDDSGLEVDILNGAPGVFSARYAGEHGDFQANCKKLLSNLIATGPEERTARFQCVLALLRHENDPSPLICQGTWRGIILSSPVGDGGFGYDPVFYVPTHNCSAAELLAHIKNQISHRAQATAKLLKKLAATAWL
jgi:XTP/dITP diphosphohydrolase